MKIITLSKTKELLGITDSSLDTKISRYIPIIDSKVKQITNNKYNMQIIGDTIYNSNIVKITGITNSTGGINNSFEIDGAINYLKFGDMISGTNIPANSYIDDIYMANNITPTIELSETATATGTDILITVGFNIGLQTTVAKGIYWLISQENTNEPGTGWSSKKMGPISVSRGDSQAKIDGRYGMPVWFVNAFPRYMSVS